MIMKTEITVKERYEVPKVEIYETLNEGFICTSDTKSASGLNFIEDDVYGDGTNVWGN